MSEEKHIIVARINVLAVKKERLFKGEKGTYLDITLIPSKDGKFGNDFIVFQSMTKEERLAGKERIILGNAKFARKKPTTTTPSSFPAKENDSNPPSSPGGGSDDVRW